MSEKQPLTIETPTTSITRSIDDVLEHAYSTSNLSSLLRFYIIFFALGLANSGDASEMGCMGSIMASSQFQQDILQNSLDSGADFAKRGAAITGAHLLGMMISGLVAGVLADIWGRRSTLLLGLSCNAIVGIASALTRTAAELISLRFICGLGIGLVIGGVVALSAEIAPPSKRGQFMSIVGACYVIGNLYISFLAVMIFQSSGSGNWRLFILANAAPTLLSLSVAVFHVPESPRYYLSRGMLKEAADATNTIANKLGNVEHALTKQELQTYLFQAKALERSSMIGKSTLQHNQEVNQPSLVREFLAKLLSLHEVYQNGLYKCTIPLQCAYVCLTLVTGINFWLTKIFQGLNLTVDPFVMNLINTLAQIPGIAIATYLIDKIGRRSIVAMGCAIMTTMLYVVARIVSNRNAEENAANETLLILVFSNLSTIGLCLGWLGLDCLTSESYPTKIRSTGINVCKATGRAFGFLVQFIYGPLINSNRFNYALGLASAFSAIGVLIAYHTKETLNVNLNDHWEPSKKKDDVKHGRMSYISA